MVAPTVVSANVSANLASLLNKQNFDRFNKANMDAFGALFGMAAASMRYTFEVKYPNDYGKDPIALMQIVAVRQQMRSTLQSFSKKARRLMLQPTIGWEHKPEVKLGDSETGNEYGFLDTDTGAMGTGAYVKATELASIDPDKQTQNDANWHYIWTNNGVYKADGIGPTPGRGILSGKGRKGNVPMLKFKMPYNAATTAGSLAGGAHSSGDTFVFKEHVPRNVPARDFTGQIAALLQPEFNAAAIKAVMAGIDKYKPQIADSHVWKNK